jgi:hypothetical protein
MTVGPLHTRAARSAYLRALAHDEWCTEPVATGH